MSIFSIGFRVSSLPPPPSNEFQNVKEKAIYTSIKTSIQKYILEKGSGEYSFNRASLDAPELMDGANLSQKTFDRLAQNIKNAGLAIRIEEANNLYPKHGTAKVPGSIVTVYLPNTAQDESGYMSDGWNPDFRASKIDNKMKSDFLIALEKTGKSIEEAFEKHPDVREHSIHLHYQCPRALQNEAIRTITDELRTRGFSASKKEETLNTILISKHLSDTENG